MTRPAGSPKRIDAVKWCLWLMAVGAMATGALLGSARAHASTPDDTYLAALSRHGITGDPQALIDAGHDTCDAMAQGYVASGFAIWKPNGEFLAAGLSYTQTMQAEHDAVNALCSDRAWWRD